MSSYRAARAASETKSLTQHGERTTDDWLRWWLRGRVLCVDVCTVCEPARGDWIDQIGPMIVIALLSQTSAVKGNATCEATNYQFAQLLSRPTLGGQSRGAHKDSLDTRELCPHTWITISDPILQWNVCPGIWARQPTLDGRQQTADGRRREARI